MIKKVVKVSLATLLFCGIAKGGPPNSSGCFGPNISRVGNYGSFGNFSGSGFAQGGCLLCFFCKKPGCLGTCRDRIDIESVVKSFGKSSGGTVFYGSENIGFNNPVEYTTSLYGEAIKLWLQNDNRGIAVYKQEENKLEYVGGTLMPILGENNTSLAVGNFIQFVDDFNIERLVLSDKGRFTSKGRLINVFVEDIKYHVKKINYIGANFHIEEIIKDESAFEPTENFLQVDYENGNIKTYEIKNEKATK